MTSKNKKKTPQQQQENHPQQHKNEHKTEHGKEKRTAETLSPATIEPTSKLLTQETTLQHFSPTETGSSNSQNQLTPENSEIANSSNRSDDSCKLIIDDDVESSQDSANITKDLFSGKIDSSEEIQRNSQYCDKDKQT